MDERHEGGDQPGIEIELSPTASTALPRSPRRAGRRHAALAVVAVLGAAILISGAGGRLRAGELGPFAGPELVDEASDDSASGGRIRTRGADWTIARHFGGWSAYPGNDEVVGDDELDGDDLLADDEYVYSDELASSEGYDDETEYVDQFSGSGAITYTRPFPRAGSSTGTITTRSSGTTTPTTPRTIPRPPSPTTPRVTVGPTSRAPTPTPTPTAPPTGATQLPVTNPPATNPPATNPPATNPPATNPPATDPPATDPPATDPPPTTQPPTTLSATTTTAASTTTSTSSTTTTTQPETTTTSSTTTSTSTTSTSSTTSTTQPTTTTTLPSSNTLEVLRADARFSVFVAAIDEFGLTDELDGPEPVTVLALTDDVLATLAPLDEAQLRLHLLAAAWTRPALLGQQTIPTIDEGVVLTVDAVAQPPTVGAAVLLDDDLPASNGHVLVVGGFTTAAP